MLMYSSAKSYFSTPSTFYNIYIFIYTDPDLVKYTYGVAMKRWWNGDEVATERQRNGSEKWNGLPLQERSTTPGAARHSGNGLGVILETLSECKSTPAVKAYTRGGPVYCRLSYIQLLDIAPWLLGTHVYTLRGPARNSQYAIRSNIITLRKMFKN